MKSKLSVAIPIVLISILNSCSSKPTISELEELISDKIESESNGTISLVTLEETNSEEQEVLGQAFYTIHYRAKIKFNQDCYMYVDKSGLGPYLPSFKTYIQEPEFIPSMQRQVVRCVKESQIEINDKIRYKETEKGWEEQPEIGLF